MKINFLTFPDAEFASLWHELWTQQECVSPLAEWRLIEPALRILCDEPPKLVFAESAGRVHFMTILVDSGFGRIKTFSPSQVPFCMAMSAAGCQKPTLSSIFQAVGHKKYMLEFRNVDPDYEYVDLSGASCIDVPYGETMSIEVKDFDFEKYWGERTGKLRNNLSRYWRRANSDFQVSFRHVNKSDAIADRVHAYSILESKGWKGRAGTALSPGNSQFRFYSEILDSFSDSGNAHVFELYFDDSLVASRLAISNSNQIVFLKTTYSEDMRTYAPGRLLLKKVISECLNNRLHNKFEFYTKATKDQLQWATSSRWIFHSNCFRNSTCRGIWKVHQRIKQLRSRGTH